MSHFTGERTEAQKNLRSCPSHTAHTWSQEIGQLLGINGKMCTMRLELCLGYRKCSAIQRAFTECLPCVRRCAGCCGFSCEQSKVPALLVLISCSYLSPPTAVPWTWNILPPGTCMTRPLASFSSLLKCHLISEASP